MERQNRIAESWAWELNPWLPGYWRDTNGVFTSAGHVHDNPQDRKHGFDLPFVRSEADLARYREQSQNLCQTNSQAKGLLKNLTNYIIGKGYKYKCVAKEKKDVDLDQPGIQNSPASERLVKLVQQVVDEFTERNKWQRREREIYRRVLRDGEAFIRYFTDDGKTEIRMVEPSWVSNPLDAREGDGWTFGIQHEVYGEGQEDVESAKRYHIVHPERLASGYTGEIVKADEIHHIKHPDTDSTVKRGMPSFTFDAWEAFHRAGILCRNLSEGAAIQAAIAEIIQFETATQAQVSSLMAGERSYDVIDPISGKQTNYEDIRPGTKVKIPKGMEYVQTPFNQGIPHHIEVLQADLRCAVSSFNAPEYFTGDASSGNYAATKEAGAPFLKGAEADQDFFAQEFLVCIKYAVAVAAEAGNLPDDVLDKVEIQVEPPLIVQRDPLQQTQKLVAEVQARITSPQTAQMELGREPETEAQNWEEWDSKNGQQMPGLPIPDDKEDQRPFGGFTESQRLRESQDEPDPTSDDPEEDPQERADTTHE